MTSPAGHSSHRNEKLNALAALTRRFANPEEAIRVGGFVRQITASTYVVGGLSRHVRLGEFVVHRSRTGLHLGEVVKVEPDSVVVCPIETGEEITEGVDLVIAAVGQYPKRFEGFGVATDRKGRITVREDSMLTSRPGVYAGGDCVLGPSTLIESVAQGRVAASAMDIALGGDGDISEVLLRDGWETNPWIGRKEGFNKIRKFHPILLAPEKRSGWDEVELAFDDALAGEDGRETIVRDPFGRLLDVVDEEPVENGEDVYSTIDHRLQAQVEQVLRETRAEWGAKGATAIVCSLWAPREPSALRRVHPSGSVKMRSVVSRNHGSIATTSPGFKGSPRPGRPLFGTCGSPCMVRPTPWPPKSVLIE